MTGWGSFMRRMYSWITLRSSLPKAAASRLRLPDTAATISYCSAPTRLKSFAFGEASITVLRSASETGSSCTSISPMAISFSTKDRSRNLSRSTLRDDIVRPLFVSLRQHFARRVDHRVDAAGVFDRAGDVHVERCARVVLAAHARRPRRLHDLLAECLDRGVELGGGKNLTHDAGLASTLGADHGRRPDQVSQGLARHPID